MIADVAASLVDHQRSSCPVLVSDPGRERLPRSCPAPRVPLPSLVFAGRSKTRRQKSCHTASPRQRSIRCGSEVPYSPSPTISMTFDVCLSNFSKGSRYDHTDVLLAVRARPWSISHRFNRFSSCSSDASRRQKARPRSLAQLPSKRFIRREQRYKKGRQPFSLSHYNHCA